MMKSGKSESTRRGYLNDSNQLNYGYKFTAIDSSASLERTYKLECQFCKKVHNTTGDAISQKQCPVCQVNEKAISVAA